MMLKCKVHEDEWQQFKTELSPVLAAHIEDFRQHIRTAALQPAKARHGDDVTVIDVDHACTNDAKNEKKNQRAAS
ncbi:MAG: hypothetical protein CUN54_08990 [Phototrophicales bacterium]|nr:MAG: hypothetical protein CUN54_08990 [Phototrophicales bacterium]